MTIQRAIEATKQRLRFGDRQQIEAVDFLSAVERMFAIATREKWRLCPACNGDTYVKACDCGECERDEWLESCGLCNETGVVDADGDLPAEMEEADDDVCAAIAQLLRSAELVEYVEAMKGAAA